MVRRLKRAKIRGFILTLISILLLLLKENSQIIISSFILKDFLETAIIKTKPAGVYSAATIKETVQAVDFLAAIKTKAVCLVVELPTNKQQLLEELMLFCKESLF